MAFQIDPNIPLQANKVQFDPAAILMQAQQNAANLEKHRLEMQKLREDYDLAKEKRKQEKAMQMGIASDLAGIQNGTPAQYAPMQFQQQPQQPKAYTGDLMGGDFQLGGNNDPTNGNYQLGGGEVTQEAVAGREPSYLEQLQIAAKRALQVGDVETAFKYTQAMQQQRVAEREQNAPVGNPYPTYDAQGNFVGTRVMTKAGQEIAFGTQGTTTVKPDVLTAKDKAQLQFQKNQQDALFAQQKQLAEFNARKQREIALLKPDPVEKALEIERGKEKIKTESEQRKTVAGKYADAAEAIPLLDGYIAALEKTPANFAMSMIYKGKGLVSDDNPELQAVSMANQKAKTLINYAQKQPGPSTDADVRNYLDQVGIASDITMPRDARLAAAKSARDFAKTIVKKFGNYASKILTGEITPEELQNLQPDKPQQPTLNDRFNDLKEYRANRAKYAKDPTALRILDEQARADGLIK